MQKPTIICDICKNTISDNGESYILQHGCGDDAETFDVCERCFSKIKQRPFDKAAWLYDMRKLMREYKITYDDIANCFDRGDRLHFRWAVSNVLTSNGAKSKSDSMNAVEEAIRKLAEQRRETNDL